MGEKGVRAPQVHFEKARRALAVATSADDAWRRASSAAADGVLPSGEIMTRERLLWQTALLTRAFRLNGRGMPHLADPVFDWSVDQVQPKTKDS